MPRLTAPSAARSLAWETPHSPSHRRRLLMNPLIFSLWLPVLVSAIIVFIASSIIHMLLPYHQGDYQRLPYEDNLLAVLGAVGLKRGLYSFPFGTYKEIKSPA